MFYFAADDDGVQKRDLRSEVVVVGGGGEWCI